MQSPSKHRQAQEAHLASGLFYAFMSHTRRTSARNRQKWVMIADNKPRPTDSR